MNFIVHPWIFWAETDRGDDLLVLDERRGTYLVLHGGEREAFRALTRGGVGDPSERAVENLVRAGVVAARVVPKWLPSPRLIDVATYALINLVVQGVIRLAGWRVPRVLRVLGEGTASAAGPQAGVGADTIERAVAIARKAAGVPFVSTNCLVVAVSLFALMRIHGLYPTLRLGAVPRPFEAHAWVELDGVVVDPGGSQSSRTPFGRGGSRSV